MPVGIDLFCGAGGLSLGAETAGIDVRIAIEYDRSAATTYKRNHNSTRVICDDIHNVAPSSLGFHKEEVFVVFGGPPCQGFSTSNTKTRNIQNPNNSLFEEFVRFVRVLRPLWFVFENVEGIVKFAGGKTLSKIINCFEALGYVTNHKVMLASEYGVPQHRNRFILVGNRNGISFEFPQKFDYVVSVGDAISDLPILENGQMADSLPYALTKSQASEYARSMREGCKRSKQNFVSHNADYVIERYRFIGQGDNWKAIPSELMRNYRNIDNCHSGIYKRLRNDSPSVVISNYRKNMLIHPTQDRGLSVREAARLQSFPDKFVFCGSLMHIQQQIGNAVPPLLAKAVFRKIMEYGE